MLEDFGIEIKLNGIPITVIFDNGYYDALGVWSTIPRLTGVETDFEDAAVGDSFTIENVAYTIAESPQPDGFGIVDVILQRT